MQLLSAEMMANITSVGDTTTNNKCMYIWIVQTFQHPHTNSSNAQQKLLQTSYTLTQCKYS